MSPIPIKRIPIELEKDFPSKVTPEELKKELNAIGLTCGETKVENLKRYIDETVNRFPHGQVQGFGIFDYASPSLDNRLDKDYSLNSISEVIDNLDNIHSNWKPSDKTPYRSELATVGFPEHFDYLLNHYIGFAGTKSSEHYKKKDTTVDAIKSLFTEIAINISSTLVTDLDRSQLEALFNKIIAPVDPGAQDYDSGVVQRNVFLVEDYNDNFCAAIGVLNVEYHLTIKNYKEKKTAHKDYDLDVTIRTSLYTEITDLISEDLYIKTHFKRNLFLSRYIPCTPEVKIYDELPTACSDTFVHSLPLEQTQNEIISVMVLYAPNLENIGCIDNTDSDGSAQYSKTITSGFTFTFGQKLAAGLTYSAGTLFQKAEFNVNMEISFTEQWNNSQSETISFSVPHHSKAYLYQGYLQCAVLQYNVTTFTYSYKETGTFLTNIMKTTPKPIDLEPALMISQKTELNQSELPLWEQV